MIIIFLAVIVILLIFLIYKTGSLNGTINTKFLSYLRLKNEYPNIPKRELYRRMINLDPFYDNYSDTLKNLWLEESENLQMLIIHMLAERFVYSKKYDTLTRISLIQKITEKVNAKVPENY